MLNCINILSDKDKIRLFTILCSLFNVRINYNIISTVELFGRYCAQNKKEVSSETISELLRSRSIICSSGESQPIMFNFSGVLTQEVLDSLSKFTNQNVTLIILGG